MKTPIGRLLIVLSSMFALAGCEQGAPAPKHDHSAHDHAHDHTAEPAVENGTKEAPGPAIETGSFHLAVAPAQPEYGVGKSGELEIALESRGEWHVNQDYPIRVDLKAAPGLQIPKPELVREDAKEFGDERVRFLAAVKPSKPGKHDITCDVSFAMCTEENCILEKRTVAMELEVE